MVHARQVQTRDGAAAYAAAHGTTLEQLTARFIAILSLFKAHRHK